MKWDPAQALARPTFDAPLKHDESPSTPLRFSTQMRMRRECGGALFAKVHRDETREDGAAASREGSISLVAPSLSVPTRSRGGALSLALPRSRSLCQVQRRAVLVLDRAGKGTVFF